MSGGGIQILGISDQESYSDGSCRDSSLLNDIANPFYRGFEVVTSRYAGALAEALRLRALRDKRRTHTQRRRVGHSTAAEPSILWLAHRLGRRSLQKLTRERSQPKSGHYRSEKEVQPKNRSERRPLQKQPPKKTPRGDAGFWKWDDSGDWTSRQRGAVLQDSLFRELLGKTSER